MSYSIPLYPIRSSIDTVVAETGGGKGVLGVIGILSYMSKGFRVGTNYNLFLEHFPENVKDQPITRIPDLPNRDHLESLGFGSDVNNKNKDQYGGLFWDEVSLFLDSKRTPEFKATYAWLKQRRKKHWNILFTAQHEDQLQDELYKSLVNRLIVVGAADLDPVPFIGGLLRLFGFSGYQKEGHYFYLFKGKTRTTEVVSSGEYPNRPFRKLYDTDQVFDHDTEWLLQNGEWRDVDMRAIYTYLPKSYLVDKDFLGIKHRQYLEDIKNVPINAEQFRQKQLDLVSPFNNNMEQDNMALPNRHAKQKRKVVLWVMIIFVGTMISMLVNNFFSGGTPEAPVKATKQLNSESKNEVLDTPEQIPIPESETLQPEYDHVAYLFNNFDYRLSSYIDTGTDLHGKIHFYDNENKTTHASVDLRDFLLFDYSVTRVASGVMIKNADNKYLVTSTSTMDQEGYRALVTRSGSPNQYY